MTHFLILGGTGKVGRRLSTFLLDSGHTVRAVGRTTPIPFDWSEPDSWASALSGARGLFIVGPGSARDWSPALTNLLERAADAGVTHAVLLSARGVEFLPDGNVARAEAALQAGSVPWTILRPSHFAQNFTEAMFVPEGGRVTAPLGSGAEPFIDVADIAEVAARILIDATSPGGTTHTGVVTLSGPSALTMREALTVIGHARGERLEFHDETEESHERALLDAGTPPEYVRWRLAMLRGIRLGQDAYVSAGVRDVLGRDATSFETWALRDAG